MFRHLPVYATLWSLLGLATITAKAADQPSVTLLRTPVDVTATFNDSDVGVYFTQISVHSGPIAQLVDSTVHANSRAAAEQQLQQAVHYHAPYLLVHASCGGGAAWRCESEVIFKIVGETAIRLGEVIGNANGVLRSDRFYDRYDKLEQRVDGLSHATSPAFTIVLNELNNTLTVDGNLTWQTNQSLWRTNAGTLTAMEPDKSWTDAEWEPYFSAAMTNAALARYCERQDELQALLQELEPKLDAFHRRALTDALSKVVPGEAPKAWRHH